MNVQRTAEPIRTTQRTAPRPDQVPFIRLNDGSWVPNCVNPVYVSAIHSDPAAAHMHIPVILRFPGRSSIRTLAFLDSGAQTSLIGEHFVSKHSLGRHLLDNPLLLKSYDGSSSDTVTQGVLTHLSISSHSEHKSFGVARMPHNLILGIDWLRRHNPIIGWSNESLSFSCCGSDSSVGDASLTSAKAGNSDLDSHSVDLGPSRSRSPRVDSTRSSDLDLDHSHSDSDLGMASKDLSASQPPDIQVVDVAAFFSIPDVAACGILRPSPGGISTIGAISSQGSPQGESAALADPSLDRIKSLLPEKYHSSAHIFRDKEVEVLAPHRPQHDIKIEIEDGKSPPFGPIYSLSQVERETLRNYINDMLRRGFIQPSTSPAASPVLFVKKANGALRLCVDYRGLNAITRPNRYPLPLVSDLLDTIRGSRIFSKLDLKSAFNLLRVAKGDEWKTAFRTNEGLYEYLVMPFGLKNAPAAWQSFIQWVLRSQLGISCIVYLDDILIFSKNQSDHDRDVLRVLRSLEEYGLYCNVEKCEFDRTELEYLGFLIGLSGVRMHPSKLDTIASWQPPSSVRGVQKWLGFTNFYRRFIKNYAMLALPLNDLTRKDSPTPFKLTPEALASFEAMRDTFQTAPLLVHFDHSKPSFLHTDASDFAIAAILSQYGNDDELPSCGILLAEISSCGDQL